jgi:two-component system LytT family response regulator
VKIQLAGCTNNLLFLKKLFYLTTLVPSLTDLPVLMLKAVILDDELSSCETLEWQLKEFCPDVEIVGIYRSPEIALKEVPKLKPDVVFLDIEMPHINGFEWLNKIENIDFDIIFTTAYDKYAI